jgi:hypothetical protein
MLLKSLLILGLGAACAAGSTITGSPTPFGEFGGSNPVLVVLVISRSLGENFVFSCLKGLCTTHIIISVLIRDTEQELSHKTVIPVAMIHGCYEYIFKCQFNYIVTVYYRFS